MSSHPFFNSERPLQAVLFDLDGTLIDTAPDFILTLNALRQHHHLPELEAEQIRSQVSNGARALIALGFGHEQDNPHFQSQLTELLDRYEQHLSVASRVFTGLDTALNLLESRRIPWGIVTNKPSRFTLPLIEQLNLSERCATAICPDHVTNRKPHPEPIFKACGEIGVDARHTLYVGDHARDIEAGRRAGNITVAAGWGYLNPGEQASDWQADVTCATPDEFNRWLRENLAE